MKNKEASLALGEAGWICSRDEVGDYFCFIYVGEIWIQVIPSIGKRSDHYRVSLMPSVSSRSFSEVAGFIIGEGERYTPIIVNRNPPEKIPRFSSDDVWLMAEKAKSWALNQDLNAGLAVYRNLPTDSKGEMPLRHLAALAVAKDVSILMDYKKSFEAGDRLGFVPYITRDMIDRALLIAMDGQNNSK
jgi:hypothetical protein